jgi:hypothetical protein
LDEAIQIEFTFSFDVRAFASLSSLDEFGGSGRADRTQRLGLQGAELRDLRQTISGEYSEFFREMAVAAAEHHLKFSERQDGYVLVRPVEREDHSKAYWDGGPSVATIFKAMIDLGGPIALGASGSAAAIALLKNTKDLIVAWMKSNANKSVSIRIGKVSVQIKGSDDVDEALKAAFVALERSRAHREEAQNDVASAPNPRKRSSRTKDRPQTTLGKQE